MTAQPRPSRQGRGHREDHDRQALTFLRKNRGWSLKTMAKEIGISPGYLHNLESGYRPLPPYLVERIAAVLDCPPSFFMRNTG
jgi:transcriptional regulator with XRE-family HTH domain